MYEKLCELFLDENVENKILISHILNIYIYIVNLLFRKNVDIKSTKENEGKVVLF